MKNIPLFNIIGGTLSITALVSVTIIIFQRLF